MMGGLIDLNTVNEDEDDNNHYYNNHNNSDTISTSVEPKLHSSSSPSPPSPSSSSSSVCMELWHACAGPLISLPKKGSLVAYLPQGHILEQHSFSDYFPGTPFERIPPHVFCRVLDVKLHAEAASDEVYAQVSLIPEAQIDEKVRECEVDVDGEEEEDNEAVRTTIPHMFCKTLTASDTSTHGGFSVPRRAAEDCFPPLDYKQQRPSQELVAKDLHGKEWRFRHIYRGQPRRHLLTTGWSAFVNKKKLVSGDAVLFLRGADGELRLGIRRATQVKACGGFQASSGEQVNQSNVKNVLGAIFSRSVFSVYYKPRISSSDFIIPFKRFLRSIDRPFSVGMRFKMRYETEDTAERRFTGVITGMSEVDPVRWPGSKWKCLLVRWDDVETNRHSRLSPWEIEPTGPIPCSSSLVSSGFKRNRIGYPLIKPDYPISSGMGISSDWGESLGSRKVLQGQEILGFSTAYDSSRENPNHPGTGSRSCYGDPYRLHRVLQGQEMHHLSSIHSPVFHNQRQDHGDGILEGLVQVPGHGNRWPCSSLLQSSSDSRIAHPTPQASSPSSVLMFQQASLNAKSTFPYARMAGPSGRAAYKGSVVGSKTSCRLFGVSLTEGITQCGDKEMNNENVVRDMLLDIAL
ncbi:hypothetical protein V2J09_002790 [Rumex salicifolius]